MRRGERRGELSTQNSNVRKTRPAGARPHLFVSHGLAGGEVVLLHTVKRGEKHPMDALIGSLQSHGQRFVLRRGFGTAMRSRRMLRSRYSPATYGARSVT